jgi:predicted  nucleic acid-binding Zn-ribbon protein
MKVKITKLECVKCGHIWIPKKEDVRQCPKCKTAYFNQKKENGNKTV